MKCVSGGAELQSRRTNRRSDRRRFKVAALLLLCFLFVACLLISHAGSEDDPNHCRIIALCWSFSQKLLLIFGLHQ